MRLVASSSRGRVLALALCSLFVGERHTVKPRASFAGFGTAILL